MRHPQIYPLYKRTYPEIEVETLDVTQTLKLSINVETLSGTKTLTITDKVIQWQDPDGSDRDVVLPPEADSTNLKFWGYNNGSVAGKNLVYKNDGGTTIATLGPGTLGIFGCDGTDWKWENDLGIYYDAINDHRGIGTVSPNDMLEISSATTPTLRITGAAAAVSAVIDYRPDANASGIFQVNGTNRLIFRASSYQYFPVNDTGVGTTTPHYKLDVDGEINSRKYYWRDDFDDEADGVQLAAGLRADFWTLAGTNYAAANLVYRIGNSGEIEAKCAAADNDSVTILGIKTVNIDQNPILEARIKIDTKETACFFVGFVDAAFADKAAPANNMCCVGIDSDDGHGFGATQIVALSNDNGGGGDYDDMGSAIVSDTYIKIKIDLTDTEQPRVWIDDTEIAAGSITGTVKAATDVAPYIHVQNLAGGAIQRFVTVDYIKTWATRA